MVEKGTIISITPIWSAKYNRPVSIFAWALSPIASGQAFCPARIPPCPEKSKVCAWTTSIFQIRPSSRKAAFTSYRCSKNYGCQKISRETNPKSTDFGRLDIFTRLITDYGDEFERVPSGYKGSLFEVVRDEIGLIRLVAAEERVSGPGASWVMASFTHLNPEGSRFSDGSYGVYYAARELVTAIAETVFHLGRFYAATADPPHAEDMRTLSGRIDARFHDLRGGDRLWQPCLDPENYAASQALGLRLRAGGSNGLVWPSVRHAGGQCLGAFRPKAVGIPVQGRHLRYHWDGARISRYFDYTLERWISLPPPG